MTAYVMAVWLSSRNRYRQTIGRRCVSSTRTRRLPSLHLLYSIITQEDPLILFRRFTELAYPWVAVSVALAEGPIKATVVADSADQADSAVVDLEVADTAVVDLEGTECRMVAALDTEGAALVEGTTGGSGTLACLPAIRWRSQLAGSSYIKRGEH